MQETKNRFGGNQAAFNGTEATAELSRNPTTAREKSQALPVPNYADLVAMMDKYAVDGSLVNRKSVMTAFALFYADHGIHVFRAHVPLFNDNGVQVACSCEDFRSSKKCKEEYPKLYIDLSKGERCDNVGKHPMFSGINESTVDRDEIIKMFSETPVTNVVTGKRYVIVPNLAIDTGKSGLLVLDADTYKKVYQSSLEDDYDPDELDTVIVDTGGGGEHYYFDRQEKPYKSSTGTGALKLPEGIDIRGVNNYVIAPPSLHKSGNRYMFRDGQELSQSRLKPIPQKIDEVLAQVYSKAPGQEMAALGPNPAAVAKSKQLVDDILKTNSIENSGWQEHLFSDGPGWIIKLKFCPFNKADDPHGGEYESYIAVRQNGALNAHCPHNRCQKQIEDFGSGWQLLRKIYAQDKPTTRLVPVHQYCDDVLDGERLSKGIAVVWMRDGKEENFLVNNYEGEVDGVPAYSVLGSNVVIPENELFVRVDARSLSDKWMDKLKSLGYSFRLNELEDMIEVDGVRLDDITRSKIFLRLAGTKIPKHYIDDLINVAAAENSYHPIKDYLDGLQWDGKNHLGLMLGHLNSDERTVDYGDGSSQPLYAALILRWMLGCVARARYGGNAVAFKHQTPMLVLVGPQGMGKSSWVRWLASGVGFDFHRESMIDPHHPDHVRSAVTKWIWEASELGSSLRRGDRDALKGFLTQEWHTYRKPWGKANITKPLLANFVGTINKETGFLDDPTGSRRFLPVTITGINHDYKNAVDINQVWAQVDKLYREGHSPELHPAERAALTPVYQEHAVENPLQTYLQLYFDIEPGNQNKRTFTAEIMTRLKQFGVAINNNPKVAGKELNDALAPLGVERKFVSIGGVKGCAWLGVSPNDVAPPQQR